MRTTLLTSAGMDVKNEILKILPKPANQIKLAHIITASKVEKDLSYLEKERKEMQNLGFKVEEIDIEGKSENGIRNLLTDKDIIYVQGGNTFYLLKHIRKSGFDKVVKELLEKGVIYVGVSAGSIVAGPTIETSNWGNGDNNIVGLTDLAGMNLVDFNVVVHYTKEHKDIIEKEIPKSKYPVKVLTNNQAILVKGNEVEFLEVDKE